MCVCILLADSGAVKPDLKLNSFEDNTNTKTYEDVFVFFNIKDSTYRVIFVQLHVVATHNVRRASLHLTRS